MAKDSSLNQSIDDLKRRNRELPDFETKSSLVAFALVGADGHVVLDGEGLANGTAAAIAQLRALTGTAIAVDLTVTNQAASGCTVNGVVVAGGESKYVGKVSSGLVPFNAAPGGSGKILIAVTYTPETGGEPNQIVYTQQTGLIISTNFAVPCVVPGGASMILILDDQDEV